MKKTLILLVAVLICQTCLAASLTVKVGDEFVYGDVCLDRVKVGPFNLSFGVGGAFDFNVESSNAFHDLDIDIGDHYVGPVVKLHLLAEDQPVDFTFEYAALFENVRIDEASDEIISATLAYKGWGVAYQYYLDAYKKDPNPKTDRILLSWTGRF